MCSSVSNFIKTHRCLCMMTLGIAIVAYLGYRAVVVIKDKCCPTTTKTKAVTKNVFDQSATPPASQKDPFANLTSIQHVAKKVLDQVYDEFTGATPAKPFAFRIFVKDTNDLKEAPLYLEYDEDGVKTEKPLTEVIDAVAWQALDKKWENFEPKRLEAYKSKARILTPDTNHTHPFLSAYLLSYYHYTNTFLRFGKIYSIQAFTDMHSSLGKINNDIHGLAKEIFFMCAAAAGALQSLPQSNEQAIVWRGMIADGLSNDDIRKIYEVGQCVVEKAFISTSKTKFAALDGDIRLKITRLKVKSCAKDVELFQTSPNSASEREILFPPFTKFKVTKVEFQKKETHIEMEEVAG